MATVWSQVMGEYSVFPEYWANGIVISVFMPSSSLPDNEQGLHQKRESPSRGVRKIMERGFRKEWPFQGESCCMSHDTWTVFWEQLFTYCTAIEAGNWRRWGAWAESCHGPLRPVESLLWGTWPCVMHDPFLPLQSRKKAQQSWSLPVFHSLPLSFDFIAASVLSKFLRGTLDAATMEKLQQNMRKSKASSLHPVHPVEKSQAENHLPATTLSGFWNKENTEESYIGLNFISLG